MSKRQAEPCAICGEEIPPATMQHRRRRQPTYCCCREHEVERRVRVGFYQAMSQAGRAARSAAVTKSNHENPRRKKKEA